MGLAPEHVGPDPHLDSSSTTRRSRSARVIEVWMASGSPTISAMLCRGSSDEYGSWKTICIESR